MFRDDQLSPSANGDRLDPEDAGVVGVITLIVTLSSDGAVGEAITEYGTRRARASEYR